MTSPAAIFVPRSEALRADLVLILVTAIWGSTFIVNRLAPETAPPPGFVPRSEALGADLVLILVTAIWGSTFIVNRLALETAPPLVFVLVRFALASLILFPLALGRPLTPNLRSPER